MRSTRPFDIDAEEENSITKLFKESNTPKNSPLNEYILELSPCFMQNQLEIPKKGGKSEKEKNILEKDQVRQYLVAKTKDFTSKLLGMVMVEYYFDKKIKQRQQKLNSNSISVPPSLKKKYFQRFMKEYQQSLEVLKWDRIESLPKEKRQYYMGQQDIYELKRRTLLKTMIQEQIKQFQSRKGLLTNSKPKIPEQLIKTFETYVLAQNYKIDSTYLINNFEQILQKQASIQCQVMVDTCLTQLHQKNMGILSKIQQRLHLQSQRYSELTKQQISKSAEQNIRKMQKNQSIFMNLDSIKLLQLWDKIMKQNDQEISDILGVEDRASVPDGFTQMKPINFNQKLRSLKI